MLLLAEPPQIADARSPLMRWLAGSDVWACDGGGWIVSHVYADRQGH